MKKDKSRNRSELARQREILVEIIDHYAEFYAINTFVLEGMAAILSKDAPASPEAIQGAISCICTLGNQGHSIKVALDALNEQFSK